METAFFVARFRVLSIAQLRSEMLPGLTSVTKILWLRTWIKSVSTSDHSGPYISMSVPQFSQQSYSASFSAMLVIGEQRIPLAKIGPGEIYFQTPQSLPECSGQIELIVVGKLRSWNVNLPHGAMPFERVAQTERVDVELKPFWG
jgi:hypothetical protein